MKANKYQKAALKTAVYPERNALSYLSLGLVNEAGEVAGKIKKYFRGDYEFFSLREKVRAEIGDVLWYIACLADYFDLTLEEIMQENLDKLAARKEAGTLKGDGDNR